MPRANILVVEKASAVANGIHKIVQSLGHTVCYSTTTAEDALVQARTHKPDIILVDIEPEDGIVIDTVHRMGTQQQIALLYITVDTDKFLQRYSGIPSFSVIQKPADQWKIRVAIETALYTAALRHTSHKQEDVLTTTPQPIADVVVITDVHQRITFMNDNAVTLSGWKTDEAYGQPLFSVFTLQKEHIQNILTLQYSQANSTAKGTTVLHARSGNVYPIKYYAMYLDNTESDTKNLMLIFSAIAPHKLSSHYSSALVQFPHENPYPVLRIADDGTLLYHNAASAHLLEYWQKGLSDQLPPHIISMAQAAITTSASVIVEEFAENKTFTLTFTPIPNEQYVNVYGYDITDHREADRALKESHRRFSSLLEKVPLISLMLDTKGVVTFCNEYLQNLLGLPHHEIIGKNWFAHFVPDTDRIHVQKSYEEKIARGSIRPYSENHICTSIGEKKLISWTNTILRNSSGNVIGTASLGIDITEHTKKTQALRESEERYRTLVELSPLGIALHSKGKIVFCNSAAATILGAKSPQELIGYSPLDFVVQQDKERVAQRMSKIYEEGIEAELLEERFIRMDGSIVNVEVAALPTVYNNQPAIQVVFIDITERKESQEQIERQFLRLKTLYNLRYYTGNAQSVEELYEAGLRALEQTLSIDKAAILLYDNNGVMQFKLWHNISDAYRKAVEGHSPWQPDDPNPQIICVNDVKTNADMSSLAPILLQEGIESLAFIPLSIDYRIIGKFMIYLSQPHDFTQEEMLFLETIADHMQFALAGISAEKKLRESEEKFRLLSEKTAAIVAIFKDTYLYVNSAFEKATGYTAAEAMDMSYLDIFHPSCHMDFRTPLEDFVSKKEPLHIECQIITKQGAIRWVALVVDSIPFDGGEAAFFSGIDITERKQNEFLIQAQKEILEMIAQGTPVEKIFTTITSFIEQQAPDIFCTMYTPDSANTVFSCIHSLSEQQEYNLPHRVTIDHPSFVADAIRLRSQTCEKGCGYTSTASLAALTPNTPMTGCAYPALDSQRNVLGVIAFVHKSKQGIEERTLQAIQISAQLFSITLERDYTFRALEQALQKNFRRVIQNLQTHVFKLEKREDGDFYYTLSEGRNSESARFSTTAEMINTPISQLMSKDEYEYLLPYLQRAFQGEQITFEEQHAAQWFLTTYEPIVDAHGITVEVIGSSAEITQQKLIEEDLRTSEERYRLIVDTLPIGIMKMIETEEGWNYEYANTHAAMQTGFTKEELLDHPDQDADDKGIHPTDRQASDDTWFEWLQNPEKKTIHMTYRYKHKQGHYIWLDNYSIKTMNPRTHYQEVIQMVMDITEQKKAEQELHTALAKERELNHLKTRFVSTVSHEFRTPLTGILMSTELLERYFDKLEPEKRMDEIARIKIRVDELTELMDDFLLQSSVQSMSERFQPVDLNLADLCRRCFTEFNSMLREKSHTLVSMISDNLPAIYGDPKLIQHIIQNLLSNAIKYSPTGSSVYFELHQHIGGILLKVRDTGIGIPEEDMPRLFTPFYRASNTGKIKGTGLGLSIIKEFVEIHGGTISVQSLQNQGTTFVVFLPFSTTQENGSEHVEHIGLRHE